MLLDKCYRYGHTELQYINYDTIFSISYHLDSDARTKTGTLATVFLKAMNSFRFITQQISIQSISNVINMGKFLFGSNNILYTHIDVDYIQ